MLGRGSLTRFDNGAAFCAIQAARTPGFLRQPPNVVLDIILITRRPAHSTNVVTVDAGASTWEFAVSGGVFINYRGEDTRSYAVLLYRELARHLGDDLVFLDSESIKAGADFELEILGRVRSCQALLAIVGPRWLAVLITIGYGVLASAAVPRMPLGFALFALVGGATVLALDVVLAGGVLYRFYKGVRLTRVSDLWEAEVLRIVVLSEIRQYFAEQGEVLYGAELPAALIAARGSVTMIRRRQRSLRRRAISSGGFSAGRPTRQLVLRDHGV